MRRTLFFLSACVLVASISIAPSPVSADALLVPNLTVYVADLAPGDNPQIMGQFSWNPGPTDYQGSPTGTDTYSVDGAVVGTLPFNTGYFTSPTPLSGGDHVITVTYSGDAHFTAATASERVNVKFPAPQFPGDFSCPPGGTVYPCAPTFVKGTPVTITATPGIIDAWWATLHRPAPTGTVTFTNKGDVIGTAPLVGGIATLTTSTLPVGNLNIIYSWPGDNNYLAPNPGLKLLTVTTASGGTYEAPPLPVNTPRYREITSDGSAYDFGTDTVGPSAPLKPTFPIVGAASLPNGGSGYWSVASDGGIFAFGDAKFYGSTGAIKLNKPIVGMTSTPTGHGYWLVASDGGIFAYGDAQFLGSTGSIALNKPIVGMAATPTGNGYWLVASDGGIFAYGDAQFLGSTGSINLNLPIVGMTRSTTGHGYWMVARDGGIFAYGDSSFLGSTGAIKLNQPIVGMAASKTGAGYWLVASDGGVFTFGDAVFNGSAAASKPAFPIVALSIQ